MCVLFTLMNPTNTRRNAWHCDVSLSKQRAVGGLLNSTAEHHSFTCKCLHSCMATRSFPSTAEHHSLTHIVGAKCPATQMPGARGQVFNQYTYRIIDIHIVVQTYKYFHRLHIVWGSLRFSQIMSL